LTARGRHALRGAQGDRTVVLEVIGDDRIDDAPIIRSGAHDRAFGVDARTIDARDVLAGRSPSTMSASSTAFRRVLEPGLGRWRGPGVDRLVIDADSFVGEVYGYQKQGASFGFARVRGLHPILACRADTGEVLQVPLRKGSANTQRGLLRFTDELIARIGRASRPARPGLLRADNGVGALQRLAAPPALHKTAHQRRLPLNVVNSFFHQIRLAPIRSSVPRPSVYTHDAPRGIRDHSSPEDSEWSATTRSELPAAWTWLRGTG
jgi:hypothetical protein